LLEAVTIFNSLETTLFDRARASGTRHLAESERRASP
jgi:hypothetical protein